MIEERQEIKLCCANFYESDWLRGVLGTVFHPGGLELTRHMGELLKLKPGDRVLDIASGTGATSIFLARNFKCHVTGIDYGTQNVKEATLAAQEAELSHLVEFRQGDAEKLPVNDEEFDVVISECAFCTFPNKQLAASEMARVVAPGGRLGLSDVTVDGPLPEELQSIMAWVACIADARSADDYVDILQQTGFSDFFIENHIQAVKKMLLDIQGGLLAAEVLTKLGKMPKEDIDIETGKGLLRKATEMVNQHKISYALIVARKVTNK